jgi:hypothetical protein
MKNLKICTLRNASVQTSEASALCVLVHIFRFLASAASPANFNIEFAKPQIQYSTSSLFGSVFLSFVGKKNEQARRMAKSKTTVNNTTPDE